MLGLTTTPVSLSCHFFVHCQHRYLLIELLILFVLHNFNIFKIENHESLLSFTNKLQNLTFLLMKEEVKKWIF